jgi:hypothetical protein
MLTTAEHALRRALDYLVNNGIDPDTGVILDTIALVEEAVRHQPDDVLSWVMYRLPEQFDLHPPCLPVTQPPLRRDSMGYGRN